MVVPDNLVYLQCYNEGWVYHCILGQLVMASRVNLSQ